MGLGGLIQYMAAVSPLLVVAKRMGVRVKKLQYRSAGVRQIMWLRSRCTVRLVEHPQGLCGLRVG